MPRLVSLQILRAIAAMMVLIGHIIAEAEHFFDRSTGLHFLPWTRGVDLFFVISGFIILLSGRKFFNVKGGTSAFLLRRFIRVVPLYYLFTTLMVVALILVPGGVKETQLELGQILSSYFFWPWMRHDGRIAPVLSLGWTLNYEIFFYVIFAALLGLRTTRGATSAIVAIVLLGSFGTWIPPTTVALSFWCNPIIVEFALGMALAQVWLSISYHPKDKFIFGLSFLLVGFALLVILNLPSVELPRLISSGLPAMIIVTGPVFFWSGLAKSNLLNWAAVLGESSYALYLSHRFTLRVLTLVLLPIFPQTGLGLCCFVCIAVIAASFIGILVFRYLEQPMIAHLNKLAFRPMKEI